MEKQRIIKLRAWYKFEKKMVDLYKITPFALNDVKVDGVFISFDENICLMQFTGLHDKTGKEIWEGDIVSFWTRTASVEFHNGMFGYWDAPGKPWNTFHCLDGLSIPKTNNLIEVEVIGNIYETPDLLK